MEHYELLIDSSYLLVVVVVVVAAAMLPEVGTGVSWMASLRDSQVGVWMTFVRAVVLQMTLLPGHLLLLLLLLLR